MSNYASKKNFVVFTVRIEKNKIRFENELKFFKDINEYFIMKKLIIFN